MDWQSSHRKPKSNYFITFLLGFIFFYNSIFSKEEFALVIGKNFSNQNSNVFGNLDSYRVYLALKKNNFKEIILLNEMEANKPTKEKFLEEWNRLSNSYEKGIVYVSLNGGIDKEGFPYMEFQENQTLSFKEILEIYYLNQKKFIFILDICKMRNTHIFEKPILEEDFSLPKIPSSFVIFLSSNEEGRCYYESKKGGSFFTNQILELLENKNFLTIEKFSKELQNKWTQTQKNFKQEKQNFYLTWNTKQKLKILNLPISQPLVRTIEHYNNAHPFFSSILYNLENERFYEVYFINLQPFSLSLVNQVQHEINSKTIKSFFFNERGLVNYSLGFWKTKENEYEFYHILENEFLKTSFEVQTNIVRKTKKDLNGKNLFKDSIDFIEYKFSQGFLILKLYKSKIKTLAQNQLGISATRYNYDEQGNLLQEEFFDSNKKLVENSEKISKYFYEYGTSGNLEKVRKYSKKETYIKHKPAITIQKFNDNNQIVSIEYLESEERPTQNEEGIQKIEYMYEDNLLKEILYFSDYQKLRKLNYSNIKFDYNKKGELIQKSYYSFLKKRILDENQVSIYKYSYDAKSRLVSISFFDEEEKPTLDLQRRHKIVYVYDEDRLIQEKFYDTNENLIQKLDTPSYVLYFYDKNNKVTGKEKYNFQNQLLDANYELELDNSLNPSCKCKLDLKLDKFYRVNDLDFFDFKNFIGGKE